VADDNTTTVVQQYLNELEDASRASVAEPIIRDLLGRSVNRLHLLCASMLFRSYPRLTQPPLNLVPDEMLSAVVERMLKAMRKVHPDGPRQFFAMANQHIRWELNDLARRLDAQFSAQLVSESQIAAPPETSGAALGPVARRVLEAIDALPEDEREAFSLIRIQGMTQPEAAEVLGVSVKTVQRRVNRSLMLLTEKLGDLKPLSDPP
jgi:RNA polymerase sigma factor (sigma-70 family)